MTTDRLARALRASLAAADDDDGTRLRLVRQLIADVRAARPSERAALLAPPASTGDRRWDALVAGVVEDLAFHLSLPVPAWTDDPDADGGMGA